MFFDTKLILLFTQLDFLSGSLVLHQQDLQVSVRPPCTSSHSSQVLSQEAVGEVQKQGLEMSAQL